jgi:hypothetical protein
MYKNMAKSGKGKKKKAKKGLPGVTSRAVGTAITRRRRRKK